MIRENYFVAIKIPKRVGEIIYDKISKFDLLSFVSGKYISIEEYHFTLRFFGELGEKELVDIQDKLKEIKFNSFKCNLTEIGFFENKFNGVIWVGCSSKELHDLVNKIWMKVGKEKRKFHAHSTIIRFKKILDREKLFEMMKEVGLNDLNFEVKEFYLMKSELLPTGSKYSIVETYSLS